MSGKLCTGTVQNNSGNIRNSKAFCEGREYRGRGTAANFPTSGNPHEVNSESWTAWSNGWLDADANAGSYLGELFCCAAVGNILA